MFDLLVHEYLGGSCTFIYPPFKGAVAQGRCVFLLNTRSPYEAKRILADLSNRYLWHNLTLT